MKKAPTMTTSSTTVTFTATTMPVTREESFIPATRTRVSATTSRAASRSNPKSPLWVPESHCGRWSPAVSSSERMYPDQPTATTAQPSASSRMRSQPMIHAGNSPSEA